MINNAEDQRVQTVIRQITSAILLAATIYLSIQDKTASASILGALFIVTHLFANVDKLKSFTAFGVSAELREVIQKAEITIEQARELALTMARQTYYQYAVQGRMLGADWAGKNDLIRALNINLEKLDVPPEQVREARLGIFEFAQYDMIDSLHASINSKLLEKSVSRSELPTMTSYAGENIEAFSNVSDIIKNSPVLTSDDKTYLLAETQRFKKALLESIKEGYFTDDALRILRE